MLNPAENDSVSNQDSQQPGEQPSTTSKEQEAPSGTPTPPEATSWRDGLSDEFKEHNSLESFKSVDDLAKSYLHAQRLISQKVADIPKNELMEYMDIPYAPESSDAYDLSVFEGQSEEGIAAFRDIAHKAELTEGQAKQIAEKWAAFEKERAETAQKEADIAAQNAIEEIKRSYGDSFNHYKELANRAAEQVLGEDGVSILKAAGLANNKVVFDGLAKLGKSMGEGSYITDGEKKSFTLSPQDARNEIDALLSNPDFSRQYFGDDPKLKELAYKKIKPLYDILERNKQ